MLFRSIRRLRFSALLLPHVLSFTGWSQRWKNHGAQHLQCRWMSNDWSLVCTTPDRTGAVATEYNTRRMVSLVEHCTCMREGGGTLFKHSHFASTEKDHVEVGCLESERERQAAMERNIKAKATTYRVVEVTDRRANQIGELERLRDLKKLWPGADRRQTRQATRGSKSPRRHLKEDH